MAVSDDQFDAMKNTESITCPVCKMTSYNPTDIEMGYCGNCCAYTGVVNPLMKAKRFIEETRRVENLDLDIPR